jgi:hypothetical protein
MSSLKLPALLAWFKTSGDPLINIAGAYFPAWLACMIAALIGTWGLAELAARMRCGPLLKPAVLMVPVVFAGLAGGFWLLFFSAR